MIEFISRTTSPYPLCCNIITCRVLGTISRLRSYDEALEAIVTTAQQSADFVTVCAHEGTDVDILEKSSMVKKQVLRYCMHLLIYAICILKLQCYCNEWSGVLLFPILIKRHTHTA